jgi:tripartite ATP-independent transporter DctM subunit
MDDLPLAAWMLPAAMALILLGIPVSFSLMAVAVAFALPTFGWLTGIQMFRFLSSVSSNYALAAVPMFIFMGAMLERSGMGRRVFEAMTLWLGRLPGGLALATMSMCALFAAGTGIVGAVEVMVGLLALPAMRARGYSVGIASGTVCAGGSLGTMIPPSIVVVIYATVAQIPIGDLLSAVIFPGLLMTALFLGWIVLYALIWPERAPRAPVGEDIPLARKLRISAVALLPPVVLIICVIGSILAGVASVTEAAAVGALVTVLLNILYRDFTWRGLWEATLQTVVISSMILLIVAGGTMFTSIFRLQGGPGLVGGVVEALDLTPLALVLLFLLIFFVMGALLDWVSVVLICVPIFLPFLTQAGVPPIWFAVLAIIMIQTSYLTPPMAPAIFYLRSIAPPDFRTPDMYRGVLPFIGCQILTGVAVWFFPGLAIWLPAALR